MGCFVTATNIGNRTIKVENIGLMYGGKTFINTKTIDDSRIILVAGDTTTQFFDLNELQNQIKSAKLNQKLIIKAFVEDTEGKIYQKRLISVCELLKLK